LNVLVLAAIADGGGGECGFLGEEEGDDEVTLARALPLRFHGASGRSFSFFWFLTVSAMDCLRGDDDVLLVAGGTGGSGEVEDNDDNGGTGDPDASSSSNRLADADLLDTPRSRASRSGSYASPLRPSIVIDSIVSGGNPKQRWFWHFVIFRFIHEGRITSES
jgi:hypothetical protein